ncbi:MAG: DUF3883 domain-containing protein [Desulfovibrio sp.]|nr:DUF3883 domain-containing protein [Desulfovibrio sp.]
MAKSILDEKSYAASIRQMRKNILGMTQQQLANTLGVAFPTVNRWENGKAKPSRLIWEKLVELEANAAKGNPPNAADVTHLPAMGFASTSQKVRAAIEAERLAYAHSVNPAFATEISRIDPLPHQRIAVYDHMLKQDPLRFLLADDAGAGKTIMCGLYIREMLARKRIKRIIIIPPAGLVGNWRNELSRLFQLEATIVSGSMIRNESVNPFAVHDFVICSIDTIRAARAMARLADGPAFDLAVFDEAHKMSCNRSSDMRIRESERYKAASAIAGADGHTSPSKRLLPWHATHLLLLTATPHMGKEYPYFALWRLLEPQLFCTPQAFASATPETRAEHFIRRTKEEMVTLDGKHLYPMRCSSTLSYALSKSERELYDATTDYLLYIYNKAQILNRTASQLALGVFQRRLASSTWALLCSMERRVEKINGIIAKIEANEITEDQLQRMEIQQEERARNTPELYSIPTDEAEPGMEQDEEEENNALGNMVASSLTDLYYERDCVLGLVKKAREVYESGSESKFEKLREVIESPEYTDEKLLIFTEHKDTLEFLSHRLEALGYTDRIAFIHGGLGFEDRQDQIALFRKSDGARIMLCTDAAAEGVNLQFCWIMLNYDIPWNPARLEQRMGRIHRYGQKHDPVFLLNMVASNTCEGTVLEKLLDKLEAIRRHLHSDKVFDSIGRVFSEISITDWMRRAMLAAKNGKGMDAVGEELDGVLTEEQILAIESQEKIIYGDGGDVKVELPRLRADMDKEYLRRLLPGYTQAWLEQAALLLGLKIEGNTATAFRLRSVPGCHIDHSVLWDAINSQAKEYDPLLSLRPSSPSAIWVHPGEPVFEALRKLTWAVLHADAMSGAVFLDYEATEPYIMQAARIHVVRSRGDSEEILDERLVCIRHAEGKPTAFCPMETLLVLGDGGNTAYTPSVRRLAGSSASIREDFEEFLRQAAIGVSDQIRQREKKALPLRQRQIRQGLNFESAALAARIKSIRDQIRQENADQALQDEMAEARTRLTEIQQRCTTLLGMLQANVDAIAPGAIENLGYALVMPATEARVLELDPDLLCPPIEAIAMRVAIAWESQFSDVTAVHTPARARAAHLPEYPGFDLLAYEKGTRKCIEVKGTGGNGQIMMSQNEVARSANLGDEYWLYAVFGCATAQPRLIRVQNPFEKLIMRSYLNATVRHSIAMQQVVEQGEE